MAGFDRREFLKIMGLAGTTAVAGCSSESDRRLLPYITAPRDIVPGEAVWYATTCRECPAGCGLLAKNRDGHIIKVEGNPLHPVNAGKVCPRGQASLHGLYNPDRFRSPLRQTTPDLFEPISWEVGETLLIEKIEKALNEGKSDRIVFISELMTGTLEDLTDYWLSELGSPHHLMYEPLSYEPLRKAHHIVFGRDAIPTYRLDEADLLISFGAGFLETWLSNVEYARRFASFRTMRGEKKNGFVYVGPRLSLTAANADRWIAVAPGDENLVALGLLKAMLERGPNDAAASIMPQDVRSGLTAVVKDISLESIAGRTGVSLADFHALAALWMRSERPLALSEGIGLGSPGTLETSVAACLLNTMRPGTTALLDFEQASALGKAASAKSVHDTLERMEEGDVEILLVHNVNPAYSLPSAMEFARRASKVPFIVSLASAPDETSRLAHLILPTHTPFEAWGDHSPKRGITGFNQPVMGPLFNTRHVGDVLLSVGRRIRGPERFPAESFHALQKVAWRDKGRTAEPGMSDEAFWQETVRRGGLWESPPSSGPSSPAEKGLPQVGSFAFPAVEASNSRVSAQDFYFTTYPTVQFFDGRGATRPWLQELPDPLTQITWGCWVEIHPDTARQLDIKKGDMVRVRSRYGEVEAPACPMATVPEHTLAIPLGQGHTASGRFAGKVKYGNPMQLYPDLASLDPTRGGWGRDDFRVTVEKLDRHLPMANVDGSYHQFNRGMARTMPLNGYLRRVAAGERPEITLPLPEGYDRRIDFYPAHGHTDYRWAMVVDLDRCIGCGACTIACNAENNVAIVGRKEILKAHETTWLRIQRYFEGNRPEVRFLPMLCQHCDAAPCESVCPVFAPHHNMDGLNTQIYNRCFGTRFCAQNCPYKVRRFNWFTFTRPEPLNWQLNPDVTVRQKGVMEKCSFCVQRIIAAKDHAKDEGRKVRDGEFTTACAQTCPVDALIFGNLLDPESRVARLMGDCRAYQVLDYLNTKPAVIYLKRITQEILPA